MSGAALWSGVEIISTILMPYGGFNGRIYLVGRSFAGLAKCIRAVNIEVVNKA